VNATDLDQDAELERPLELGAGRHRPDEQWHVLTDPEGNELCLLRAGLDPI
jgi:hypothetical protein